MDADEALLARGDRTGYGLERVTTLCELLGRPDQAYPAIRITGATGKTSTALMVSCLLGALDLTAGALTAPHLQRVRERVRVAAEPVATEAFEERHAELAPYLAEVDARYTDRLSLPEAVAGIAYAHFADAPVDVGVVEVSDDRDPGMLARHEVTVDPAAGAVTGADERRVADGADFAVERRDLAFGGQQLSLRGVTGQVDDVYLPLHGARQADNAVCALAAVEAFLGFTGGLDPELIRTGFAAVRAPGRLEVVRRDDAAPVVLDAARDAVSGRALAAALRSEFRFRHRVVVLGAGGDAAALARELLPVADHVVVAGVTPEVVGILDGAGSVERAEDVPEAIERASGVAAREDGVVVTGSTAAVGAARTALALGPA